MYFIAKCNIEALVSLLGFPDSRLAVLYLIMNYTKCTILKNNVLQENNMNSVLFLYSWEKGAFISDIWSMHECRKYVLKKVGVLQNWCFANMLVQGWLLTYLCLFFTPQILAEIWQESSWIGFYI